MLKSDRFGMEITLCLLSPRNKTMLKSDRFGMEILPLSYSSCSFVLPLVKIRPFRYGNFDEKTKETIFDKFMVKIRPFRYGNVVGLFIRDYLLELKSDRFGMEIQKMN